MLLELTHETHFEYDTPISETYMEFRLTPLTDTSQHLLQHRQRATPSVPVRQYVDAFGNTVSYLNLLIPHGKVEVSFDSVVETYGPPFRGEGLRGGSDSAAGRALLHDYLCPTPLTEWCEELRDFARKLEPAREVSTRELAEFVSHEIHGSFRYEGEVTSVSSPVTDILRHGGGVCQDFAHLMLGVCRHLGRPARYVSGYVLPDGEQAPSASHAWCEVFDAEQGWFGMDPTHHQPADERYVRLGIGRDFNDVPPNRGVFRGVAAEALKVEVRLRPISPTELAQRAREIYPRPRARAYGDRPVRKPPPRSILEQSVNAQQQHQQQQ